MTLCFLFSGILWPNSASAQEERSLRLDPERPIQQLLRQAWTTDHGLPANTVRAFLQDEQGYLWIGTEEGLAQFNGKKFTTYKETETDGLKNDYIFVLEKDPEGGFWIGTQAQGISRYKDGKFTAYTEEDGLVNNIVNDLYIDAQGALWIATDGGISRFYDGEFHNLTTEDGLPERMILTLAGAQNGLWIGTKESGLWKMVDGEIFPSQELTDDLRNASINSLETTSDGTLWISSYSGLCRIYESFSSCYTVDDGLSSNQVWTTFEDREGALWIGTTDGGLNRLFDGEFSSITGEDGLASNAVQTIYQDREHNLWIGLQGGGIIRLRNSKFTGLTTTEGLIGPDVTGVLEDSRGNLWVGTHGYGLTIFRPDGSAERYETADGLPGNSIYALYEDSQERIWMGFRSDGACWTRGNEYHCYTEEDGLPSNIIFSIYESPDGILWFGTNNGIAKLEGDEITAYTDADGFPSQFAVDIEEGPDGQLWSATRYDGIVRINEEDDSFTQYTTDDGLTSDHTLELLLDKTNTMWIATQAGGLCRYRGGEISCVTADHGLPSNTILQIVEDDLGYLWAGTYNGVFRVKKTRLNATADGRLDSLRVEVFDTNDGLPKNETNAGTQPTASRLSDGRLTFATVGGVAIVDPSHLPVNKIPPTVVIEDVLVEDELESVSDSTMLDPGSRKLEFHYSALSYTNTGEVEYKYQLEGYDSEWITAKDRRVAYYTNLAPGTYTFRVRAANNDGIWSADEARLTLTIEPFFYETAWFYILCGVVVLLLGFGGYRFRVQHLRAREEELSRLVEERTAELRQREEELEELNEDLEEEVERQLEIILNEREKVERKRIQLEERKRYEEKLIEAKEEAEQSARLKSTILMNMSHEIRTPLTSILGFAEVLEEEIEGDLLQFAQLIHKSGKRLLDTLNSVLDMSQLEANSMTVEASEVDIIKEVEETVEMMENRAAEKGLYLEVETNGVERPLPAHIDRSFLNRIVNNLVGNALKFTEDGGITVRIDTEGAEVIMEIEDTGIGIDEEFVPQLFDAFKQESTGLRRSHEGTGLGLAITKRLVELMDGSIDVETERGIGTNFIIRFPRKLHEIDALPSLQDN